MNEIELHAEEKRRSQMLANTAFVDPDIIHARLSGCDSKGLPDCLDICIRTITGETVDISFTKSCLLAMAATLNLTLTNEE